MSVPLSDHRSNSILSAYMSMPLSDLLINGILFDNSYSDDSATDCIPVKLR